MVGQLGLFLLTVVPLVAYHHVMRRPLVCGFVARMSSLPTVFRERFTSTALLYTNEGQSVESLLERLYHTNVCVIGLGGVGSWVVEALARSGIGRMTLVDADDVCTSNINRQLAALSSTVGQFKADTLKARVLDINPTAVVTCELHFARPFNVDGLVLRESATSGKFDFVVDAVDDGRDKAAIIDACVRVGTPVITCGGAGGLTDPSLVRTSDLAFAAGDRLLSSVRRHLRRHYGYPKGEDGQPANAENRWDILSVHSAPTGRPRSSSSSSSSSNDHGNGPGGSGSPVASSSEPSGLGNEDWRETGQEPSLMGACAVKGDSDCDAGVGAPATPESSSLRRCDGARGLGSAAFASGTIGLQAAACIVNTVGWTATGKRVGEVLARRPKQLSRLGQSSPKALEKEAGPVQAEGAKSGAQPSCGESSSSEGQKRGGDADGAAASLVDERVVQEQAVLAAVGSVEPLQLWDAHCHLQLDPLFGHAASAVALARRCGVRAVAVCGVCLGQDWERVTALAEAHADYVVPSFGLHPWWISGCVGAEGEGGDGRGAGAGDSGRWARQLEELLSRHPSAHVGECGLDKAVLKAGVSYDQQEAILLTHLHLAARYGRTLTVHCVSGCWDRLLQLLRRGNSEDRRSGCGAPPAIVLHSCNTLPKEMVPHLLKLRSAVYFSLSAGGRGGLGAKTQALAAAVPPDRLLIETDSPDQLIGTLRWPREEEEVGPSEGRVVRYNEPAALALHCHQLAKALNCAAAELADRTRMNAIRAFARTHK